MLVNILCLMEASLSFLPFDLESFQRTFLLVVFPFGSPKCLFLLICFLTFLTYLFGLCPLSHPLQASPPIEFLWFFYFSFHPPCNFFTFLRFTSILGYTLFILVVVSMFRNHTIYFFFITNNYIYRTTTSLKLLRWFERTNCQFSVDLNDKTVPNYKCT